MRRPFTVLLALFLLLAFVADADAFGRRRGGTVYYSSGYYVPYGTTYYSGSYYGPSYYSSDYSYPSYYSSDYYPSTTTYYSPGTVYTYPQYYRSGYYDPGYYSYPRSGVGIYGPGGGYIRIR